MDKKMSLDTSRRKYFDDVPLLKDLGYGSLVRERERKSKKEKKEYFSDKSSEMMRKGYYSLGTLLRNTGQITIPENNEPFIVQDKFMVDYRNSKSIVRIRKIQANVKEWFFDKTERPSGEKRLFDVELNKIANDNAIISLLGGYKKVSVPLSAVWHLMRTDVFDRRFSFGNIFYVEDELRYLGDDNIAFFNESGEKVVLRVLQVKWDHDGWDNWGWELIAWPLMYLDHNTYLAHIFTPSPPIC